MARDDDTPRTPASTTWELNRVKMRRQPPPKKAAVGGADRLPALRARDPRNRITVSLQYSGGAEAWWVIQARGREWRVPGVMALQDVMNKINASRGGWVVGENQGDTNSRGIL